jgi:hypothetical protein
MKTNILILGAVVTALTITAFATEPLLSPRAAGNQIKRVTTTDAPAVSITYAATETALLSPRAAGNQAKVAAAGASETTAAALCKARMGGSPKAITECASHPGAPMDCCAVATTK